MLINHDFPQDFPPLTARQAQVLACLGDHMTTKEIARRHNITEPAIYKQYDGKKDRQMLKEIKTNIIN